MIFSQAKRRVRDNKKKSEIRSQRESSDKLFIPLKKTEWSVAANWPEDRGVDDVRGMESCGKYRYFKHWSC